MTQFVHCRGCGVQIHETAPTCPKCGAPQMVTPTASAQPQTAFNQASPTMSAANLSAKWQEVFALIDKAGGADLPQESSLSRVERNRVHSNIWASLFTWLYYFVKGMWKKGIVYLIITVVGVSVAQIVFESLFGYGPRGQAQAAWMAQLAVFIAMFFLVGRSVNTDYYKKTKTNWNGWW